MADRTIFVIGATGDVGQGIVRAAREHGWRVAACARCAERLAAAYPPDAGDDVLICTGDLGTEEGAVALWDAAVAMAGEPDAVVLAVNAPNRLSPLLEWTTQEMSGLLAANVLTHFNAAKIMLPRMRSDTVFIGIGGGTADFVIPKMAYLSMAQAALRMMYRGLARERTEGAQVRELMIVSMVNGASKRDIAQPEWVTDDEVGRHVCAIAAAPDQFPGPILQLKTREQVGQPDQASQKG